MITITKLINNQKEQTELTTVRPLDAGAAHFCGTQKLVI